MTVKILGISGTPVQGGNCDKLVQLALESAEEVGDVQTEFIALAEKEIAPCQHCQYCIENKTDCKVQDDANPIFEVMKAADGLIVGAPTWNWNAAPHMQTLMSRARKILFFTHDFRNKPFGVLTLGWFGRGNEYSKLQLKILLEAFSMIPVAEGEATSSAAAFRQKARYMEHGVLDDPLGVRLAKNVGYRVTEMAKLIEHSIESGFSFPPEYQADRKGDTLKFKKKEFKDGVWR